MARKRKRKRNAPALKWSTEHKGKLAESLTVWIKESGEYERKTVDHYYIVEGWKGGLDVGRVYASEYDYTPSDMIAGGVESLEEAKRLAEEDIDALRAVALEVEAEKADEAAEAERQRVEGLSPFNRLFEEQGTVHLGSRPVRHMNVILRDGTGFSVSAGPHSYSSPGEVQGPYTALEVGFPTRTIEAFMPYIDYPSDRGPTHSVYAGVPVDVIEQVVEAGGGVEAAGTIEYEHPRFAKRLRKLKTKLLR